METVTLTLILLQHLFPPVFGWAYCYSCQTSPKTPNEIAFSGILQQTENPPALQQECDNFHVNISQTLCKSNVCMKTIIRRPEGGRFLARYCMDPKLFKMNSNEDSCYIEHVYYPQFSFTRYIKNVVCTCQADMCNIANSVTVSVLMFVIIAVVYGFC